MSKILRRIGSIALAISLAAVAFVAIVIAGLTQSGNEATPLSVPVTVAQKPSAAPADDQLVVAVVLGQSGSDTADTISTAPPG